MITEMMQRRVERQLPPWLGVRHCPWCKQRTLVTHGAEEPWRTRVERGVTIIRGTPWFRCGHCGQDGTLEFLYYTMNPDAPEPEEAERFARLFAGGVWGGRPRR